MTLIVEDGSGLANANSYGSVAEADAYFADRPTQDAIWSPKTTAQKEEALINGTAYLDAKYATSWIGSRADIDQALDWPREEATTLDGHTYSGTEIPSRLKRALFEAAILSEPVGTVSLLAQVDNPASGIKKQRDKIDVIETEIEYVGAGADQTPAFPAIDGLVAELTTGAGSVGRRIRG